MLTWPSSEDDLPSPRLVAAWLALDCLPTERIPLWAAHWIVNGHDGPAVVALAGLSGLDPHEVRDRLPSALIECGETVVADSAAAAMVAFTAIAKLQAEGRAGERWVVGKVVEIVAPGYDESITALPLGALGNLDDEWEAGWGRPTEELCAVVRSAVAQQLAAARVGDRAVASDTPDTVVLWRPTGPQELALVAAAEWRAWPPRLPDQPIFYPVLNRDYAIRIARDWNVQHSGAGFVTRFRVRRAFLDGYQVHQVGGETILEYWIPAADLDRLNANLIGRIEVTDEFR